MKAELLDTGVSSGEGPWAVLRALYERVPGRAAWLTSKPAAVALLRADDGSVLAGLRLDRVGATEVHKLAGLSREVNEDSPFASHLAVPGEYLAPKPHAAAQTGRNLMFEKVSEWVQRRGGAALYADMAVDPLSEAGRLFRAVGFSQIGRPYEDLRFEAKLCIMLRATVPDHQRAIADAPGDRAERSISDLSVSSGTDGPTPRVAHLDANFRYAMANWLSVFRLRDDERPVAVSAYPDPIGSRLHEILPAVSVRCDPMAVLALLSHRAFSGRHVILMCTPALLRAFAHLARLRGSFGGAHHLDVIIGGQWFPERVRRRAREDLSYAAGSETTVGHILSSFGTTECGMNVLLETPELARTRGERCAGPLLFVPSGARWVWTDHGTLKLDDVDTGDEADINGVDNCGRPIVSLHGKPSGSCMGREIASALDRIFEVPEIGEKCTGAYTVVCSTELCLQLLPGAKPPTSSDLHAVSVEDWLFKEIFFTDLSIGAQRPAFGSVILDPSNNH